MAREIFWERAVLCSSTLSVLLSVSLWEWVIMSWNEPSAQMIYWNVASLVPLFLAIKTENDRDFSAIGLFARLFLNKRNTSTVNNFLLLEYFQDTMTCYHISFLSLKENSHSVSSWIYEQIIALMRVHFFVCKAG